MATTPSKEVERERLLSDFTLENLHEDVYWIDHRGHIIQLNESACKTSGYLRDELLTMGVFDLNPTELLKNCRRAGNASIEKRSSGKIFTTG
jgi:PAS domain S-box-containing protein